MPEEAAAAPPKKLSKWWVAFFVVDALVVGLIVLVAVQPNTFRISRQLSMAAPASAIFTQVNDFHNWAGWSPWEKLDPAMQKTYEGPTEGKDASYAWAGNDEVGEGRMTIVDSRPDELIQIKLEFLKPFAATNTAEFSFQPAGDQTNVIWSMHGEKNFVMKAFHLLMDMDGMVGGDFEKGLASLKTVVEAGPGAK